MVAPLVAAGLTAAGTVAAPYVKKAAIHLGKKAIKHGKGMVKKAVIGGVKKIGGKIGGFLGFGKKKKRIPAQKRTMKMAHGVIKRHFKMTTPAMNNPHTKAIGGGMNIIKKFAKR